MDNNVTIDEVYKSITDKINRDITKKIVNIITSNGYTYKIKIGYGNVFRIFCYLVKSKESIIINTIGKGFTPFSIQIRIANKGIFSHLGNLSKNMQLQIQNSKDCLGVMCCSCGKEYIFISNDKEFSKCCMICDNFTLTNFQKEDIDSIMNIIMAEINFRKENRTNS